MREARKAWEATEPKPVQFWHVPKQDVWAGGVVPLTTSSGQTSGLNYTTTSNVGSTSFVASALR